MSGIRCWPLWKSISSASGDVGPLAPSAIRLARMLRAFLSVITPSNAAGTRISSASCGISSERSADYDWFAGEDRDGVVLLEAAVFVHEPCHCLRVGVNVRCRYVTVWTDDLHDHGEE